MMPVVTEYLSTVSHFHCFALIFLMFFQKWTIHRGIRRKSGSPPRTTQNSDESGSQVSSDSFRSSTCGTVPVGVCECEFMNSYVVAY